jgi:hypothetical protein
MLPRLLRRLAHDAMVAGAGLTLRTGWRQSRHERVRLGHAWGMLQGTAAVNIGQLRTPGPGGPPARTLSPWTRPGAMLSMACKGSGGSNLLSSTRHNASAGRPLGVACQRFARVSLPASGRTL